MTAPVPVPTPPAHAYGAVLFAASRAASCRCWLCNGPARMKLAAVVARPPQPEALQAVHAAFWRKFSPEAVPSGR